MANSARLVVDGACLRVEGVLDFDSVVALQTEGDAWLREQAPAECCLDFGAVQHSNSAGTALLLAWLRSARAAGKTLRMERVPENLKAIIRLGELEGVLPLE